MLSRRMERYLTCHHWDTCHFVGKTLDIARAYPYTSTLSSVLFVHSYKGVIDNVKLLLLKKTRLLFYFLCVNVLICTLVGVCCSHRHVQITPGGVLCVLGTPQNGEHLDETGWPSPHGLRALSRLYSARLGRYFLFVNFMS